MTAKASAPATPIPVSITLNPEAVAGLAIASARATADVVSLALELIEAAGPEALPKLQSRFAVYEFGPPPGTPAERQQARRAWLLTKGFKDLTLAVRQALEEADVLLEIAATPSGASTVGALEARVANLRRAANRANLPDLMARVESALGESVAFRADMLSLNHARNCMEHRRGVVTKADCDADTNALVVSWPRFRVFYRHKGAEVELETPHQMPEGEDGESFEILGQTTIRCVNFHLGERVDFSADAFAEITFAVWYFPNELARKVRGSAILTSLPTIGTKA